jgi:hypothetical protein
MDNIKDRLDYFFNSQDISKNDIETYIGVSSGVVGKFINGKSEIGVNKIGKILERYSQLSSEWLMRGEGEMLRSMDADSINKRNINNNGDFNGVNGDVTITAKTEHHTLVDEVVFLREELKEKNRQIKEKDTLISRLLSKLSI